MLQISAINLLHRNDRKENLLLEFKGREEFMLRIYPPMSHEFASVSFWKTIGYLINEFISQEFLIICEDDHQFSQHYSYNVLQQSIAKAKLLDADILLGGVSWFQTAIQVSKDIFWIERFSGLQFTIIFKKFYYKILEANFEPYDSADYKISDLSDKMFVIQPFISNQKDFGYSDATNKNNEVGRVEKLFRSAEERFELLKKVRRYYLPDFDN